VREHTAFLQETAHSHSLSATIAKAMSTSNEYKQSARSARALIEEIGAEKFGQDVSAKNTWFYNAAKQVEQSIHEFFKTVADKDHAEHVLSALQHETTTDYLRGTLTALTEEDIHVVYQILTFIKSMIMETWKTQQELKQLLLANSKVRVSWDNANATPASTSGLASSEMSNQGQTTEMMTMMNMLIQNLTQESKRKADIDEARFGLDKEERDKKSMFTIKAAQVPAGMKPQNFKATFPGKNIGSITTQDLTRFVETIFVFTETISENAREINEFVLKLTKHCYSRGSECWSASGSNIESIVNVATENYKNNRSCHTKERESPETDYSTLSTTQRRLGEQMCMYCLSLFDPSDPEIQQFKARVRQHQELMTYTEFILFLFYTKSGSPIMMWSRQSNTLKGLEAQLITDYRSNSMSAIK
jgi:hypothetical protein